jgi:hypothetical protein
VGITSNFFLLFLDPEEEVPDFLVQVDGDSVDNWCEEGTCDVD